MKTIRFIILVSLLSGSLLPAHAQANMGEFKWGLKAGVNFAGINNLEDIEKDNGRVGFVGGAFCKIPLKSNLSLRPELLFNMKGSSLLIPSDAVGSTDRVRFTMNYLELPLSLDFEFFGIWDVHAGVQGSLLISENRKIGDSSVTGDSEDFNDFDFGWHAGTGIDLGNLGLHVRFQQSLTPFYEALNYGAGDINLRNYGITLAFSYMFLR